MGQRLGARNGLLYGMGVVAFIYISSEEFKIQKTKTKNKKKLLSNTKDGYEPESKAAIERSISRRSFMSSNLSTNYFCAAVAIVKRIHKQSKEILR